MAEWLRCALHAHTTRSDGGTSPEGLVHHYEAAAFDVLAITDHWVRTEAASTDRLLVLPSTELGSGRGPHVLALGVEEAPEAVRRARRGFAYMVSWVNEHGGVPYVAHPYWSGMRSEELHVEGLVGLEVFNASCELELGRGLSAVQWDEALEAGRPLHAIAADDCHDPGHDSPLAWVWARCEERSAAAVLAALREGSFYSSTGPVIHQVEVTSETVVVRCSPAASVTLVSRGGRGARVNAGRLGYRYTKGRVLEHGEEGTIVAASLERPARAGYGRVEVADGRGGTAWTNALWIG